MGLSASTAGSSDAPTANASTSADESIVCGVRRRALSVESFVAQHLRETAGGREHYEPNEEYGARMLINSRDRGRSAY